MRGGKREGAGRPKGSKPAPNVPKEVKADIREYARRYGPEAIEFLAETMKGEDVPFSARVSAAKEILDRGYGRPGEASEEPKSPQEGIFIEPFRTPGGNSHAKPVRLEDW